MADTDTDKGKAWLSALVEKEMVEEFDELVKELDTDRSKLLRQIVREKLEEAKHVRNVAKRVSPKIKQVARS